MFSHQFLKNLIPDLYLLFPCEFPDPGGKLESVAYIDGEHTVEEADDKAECQMSCEPVEPFQYPRMDQEVVYSAQQVPVECVL